MPEIVEPMMMDSLAIFAFPGCLNERAVKNKDIVNPIPASIATPAICLNEISCGSSQILVLMLRKTSDEIPMVLPRNKARMIPNPKSEKTCEMLSADKAMVVKKNKKTGSIR